MDNSFTISTPKDIKRKRGNSEIRKNLDIQDKNSLNNLTGMGNMSMPRLYRG